jgi:hypothetical protein
MSATNQWLRNSRRGVLVIEQGLEENYYDLKALIGSKFAIEQITGLMDDSSAGQTIQLFQSAAGFASAATLLLFRSSLTDTWQIKTESFDPPILIGMDDTLTAYLNTAALTRVCIFYNLDL